MCNYLGFNEHFQQEDNWISRTGKTIWTRLLTGKSYLQMVKVWVSPNTKHAHMQSFGWFNNEHLVVWKIFFSLFSWHCCSELWRTSLNRYFMNIFSFCKNFMTFKILRLEFNIALVCVISLPRQIIPQQIQCI